MKQDVGRGSNIELVADKPLNLNLTKSLVDTAFNARQFIQHLLKKSKKNRKKDEKHAITAHASSYALFILTKYACNQYFCRSSAPVTPVTRRESGEKLAQIQSRQNVDGMLPTSDANLALLLNTAGVGRSFSPFIIHNGTHHRIKYWFTGAPSVRSHITAK